MWFNNAAILCAVDSKTSARATDLLLLAFAVLPDTLNCKLLAR